MAPPHPDVGLVDHEQSFQKCDFGLDKRLVKAVAKLGFVHPTLVQAKCIPIALEGKDMLVRARTGSGKTAAFVLPILQKILTEKDSQDEDALRPAIRALVLVPTRELCKQIEKHIHSLTYYCREVVSVYAVCDDTTSVQEFRLGEKPDVLVGTPARIVQHMQQGSIDLQNVKTLVIDEADLVLSFGYAEDVHTITQSIGKIFQGMLMSATLSPELEKLKRVVLHNPAIVKLEEDVSSTNLSQFYLVVPEKDKFLVIYVFLKLGLLQGKGIIFVNSIDSCYKLKLFLQEFHIPAAVLNAELPLNSRLHILEEFNRGIFDYLIATDASVDSGEVDEDERPDDEQPVEGQMVEERKAGADDTKEDVSQHTSRRKNKRRHVSQTAEDEEFGVSRGIDFQGVSFVVNFDLPVTAASYTHRIGRTARGGACGTALSFVVLESSEEREILREVQEQQPALPKLAGDGILSAIGATENVDGREHVPGLSTTESVQAQPLPLVFNMRELETFRYRVEDVLRFLTTNSVRDLRAAELKQEILNSEALRSHFQEHPDDLRVLRHDKTTSKSVHQMDHLKHLPSYLIPQSMRSMVHPVSHKRRKRRAGPSQEQKIQASKAKDPLMSLEVEPDANPDDVADEDEGQDPAPREARVYGSTRDAELGESTSNRQGWQKRKRKGRFADEASKKKKKNQPGQFFT